MLLLMAISLYTSRIVLSALGVVDYGLYNVVGGFVIALGFLSGTLNTASSRFITVALTRGDMAEMEKTFSNVLFINIAISGIVLLLGETFGLWFIYNKMQIPSGRMSAAFWVFQMSMVTVVVGIISSAYNACIIAHERMKAFAYISLIDGFGKLLVAFLLLHIIRYDKLLFYAGFILLIQLIDRSIYSYYCRRNFQETCTSIRVDRKVLRSMFGFISWASYGSFVSIGFTQGLNLLLNIFFGPAVNAARAVSVQVQNAVVSFTTNFQTAINPQLIKSVAAKDLDNAQKLFLASSKFSFFLLCILGVPLVLIAPTVLNLWLKEVPDHTVPFVRMMIVISIWSSLANPLRIVNQAEGNIRKFQLYEGTALLLIVPVAYVALRMVDMPEVVFIVHLVIELLSSLIRIKIVLPKIGMTVWRYCCDVYVPLLVVFSLSMLFGWMMIRFLPTDSLVETLCVLMLTESVMLGLIYRVGLKYEERNKVVSIIKNKIIRKYAR